MSLIDRIVNCYNFKGTDLVLGPASSWKDDENLSRIDIHLRCGRTVKIEINQFTIYMIIYHNTHSLKLCPGGGV